MGGLHKQKAAHVVDVSAAQQRAADPTASVWVGASAGSGKTKVLADRVTRLLLEDVRPERILCLTFTRAAAAEMSIRLTQRLSRWAICPEDELKDDLDKLFGRVWPSEMLERARRLLARVLSCAGGMRLMTIHAFAQEVLRRFPLEAGLTPTFAVMEEAEAQNAWTEAQASLLKKLSKNKSSAVAKAFARLIAVMGERSINDVVKDIRAHAPRLRRAITGAGGLDALARNIRAALALEPNDTIETFRAFAVAEGAFDRAGLLRAARLIVEKGSPQFKSGGETILHWLEVNEAERAAALDDYISAFLIADGSMRAKFINESVARDNPALVDAMNVEARRLIDMLERCDSCARAEETVAALTLGLAMIEAYDAVKKRRAALDFDDLIDKALAVLTRAGSAAWVLYKLDGGIDHMLLDEAQDTNPAQWEIVKILASEFFSGASARDTIERTLFVVGDEKQSIYSFLKADPRVFNAMHDYFDALVHAAEKRFEPAALTVSFRSAPAVLKAVDAVFADDAVRQGVSRESVVHQAFRARAQGRVEVWPLFVAPADTQDNKRVKEPVDWTLPLGYQAAANPSAEMAAALALQIKRWVVDGQTVYDRDLKVSRTMSYGDILVLVQKRGVFVSQLVSALKKIGVDVSGVDRMRLAEQLAVMDLLALMQFTLLPQDDLTLACVLRSPLIGMSEDDLMRLAIGRGQESLWKRLEGSHAAVSAVSLRAQQSNLESSEASLGDCGPGSSCRFGCACSSRNDGDVFAYLSFIKTLAENTTPLALLIHVLAAPCPADPISGRRAMAARLGADAEDPMDELLNAAEAFSARHAPSLQAFVYEMMESETDVKREMEGTGGRVRIMTVHGSKGLEAPVVVLPDATVQPDRKKIPALLWDEKASLPFYVPRVPLNGSLRLLREGAYDRQMEEYRRLLYVALTRAADRLYIGGFAKTAPKEDAGCWYNMVVRALKPLHEVHAPLDTDTVIAPQIVMGDYEKDQGPGIREQGSIQRLAFSLQEKEKLPSWIFAQPVPEPSPPRPLAPSRPSQLEEEPPNLSPNDPRFARGRIIHRLLQSLPDVERARREDVARRFLSSPQHALPQEAQREIAAEVLHLLNDPVFAPLFGVGSRAEVPIIGLSGDRLIAGQVDRLAQVGDEVWIVDYKTNRPPPADAAGIPAAYRVQMAAYRTVLKAIYPQARVRCFLLWTHAARLMEVEPR